MIEALHFPYWDDLLKSRLVDNRAIGRIEKALAKGEDDIERILVEHMIVPLEELLKIKSEHYGVPYVNLKDVRLRHELVRLIPEGMCRRYNLICIGKDMKIIQCVMNDPSDYFARDYVQMRTGFEVKPLAGYHPDILEAIGRVFSHPDFSLPETGELPRKARSASTPIVSLPDLMTLETPVDPGAPRRTIRLDEDLIPARPVSRAEDQAPSSAAPAGAQPAADVTSQMDLITLIGAKARELGANLDHQKLVSNIVHLAKDIFNAEGASLILLDEGSRGGREPYLKFYNAVGEKASEKAAEIESVTLSLSEPSLAAWILTNRQPLIDNDVQHDPRHNRRVDDLIGFVTRNLLGVPVILGDDAVGVMEVVNKPGAPFNDQDLAFLSILTSHAAMSLHNAKIFEKLKNFSLQAVELLIDCLDAFEPQSRGHMVRVARIATSMGESIGLAKKNMEDLCYAAFLHDIGKIKCAPGEMNMHPLHGASILQHIKLFEGLIGNVLMHHERLDGSGFPRGIRGGAFPLDAQILALAEAFEEAVHEHDGPVTEGFLEELAGAFGRLFSTELREPFMRVAAEVYLPARRSI
jgi:HD-GYP domain-containing protein (c-di-GMP phosphodiesterase class II)